MLTVLHMLLQLLEREKFCTRLKQRRYAKKSQILKSTIEDLKEVVNNLAKVVINNTPSPNLSQNPYWRRTKHNDFNHSMIWNYNQAEEAFPSTMAKLFVLVDQLPSDQR